MAEVLVRKASKGSGGWELVANNTAEGATRWGRGVSIIGRVVWAGQLFVPMKPRDA